jgi:hypothetical protein
MGRGVEQYVRSQLEAHKLSQHDPRMHRRMGSAKVESNVLGYIEVVPYQEIV